MKKFIVPVIAISALIFIARPPQAPNTYAEVDVEEELVLTDDVQVMNIIEMIEYFEGENDKEVHYQEENLNNKYNENDLYWLSRIISAEAKGESQKGQIAVGNVVMNRVESSSFPNNIKEVIFQNGQFCPVRNGSLYDEPTEEAIESAILVLEGEKVVSDNVVYFYNHQVVSRGSWIRSRQVIKQIGNHNFAK